VNVESSTSNRSTSTAVAGGEKVAVVIVNWNGGLLMLRCLESVTKCEPPVDMVIVVDNGSADGSVAAIQRYYPSAILVRNAENRGFAAACNQGMAIALDKDIDFVFLLNNDAVVFPRTIAELALAARRSPDAGLLGGKILTDGGERIWCAGVDVGFYPNMQKLRGHLERDRGQYAQEQPVAALTGCGLLIRRSLLEQVGLLDEDFFVYVEDIDFAWRAAKAGSKSLYVPSSVMHHDWSTSTGGGYSPTRKYMMAYNLVVFVRKHQSVKSWTAFLIFEILLWPVLFLASLVRGQRRAALAKCRGTWSALLGMPFKRPEPAPPSR
jgi:GT2 family glycosyltransferase